LRKKPKQPTTRAERRKRTLANEPRSDRNNKGQFIRGVAANPGGRPKDTSGFRERCRERTTEIIEVLESVFFTGHWPHVAKRVSDAVRMNAGVLLVSHGWGTPPSSHLVHVELPSAQPRLVNRDHSAMAASRIYEATLRSGFYDDSGALGLENRLDGPAVIEGEAVDVTQLANGRDLSEDEE
jgi:hypothetical protein